MTEHAEPTDRAGTNQARDSQGDASIEEEAGIRWVFEFTERVLI